MLGKDAASGFSRSTETDGAVVDPVSSLPANLSPQTRQDLVKVPAVEGDKGLFAQLTGNPFFTAVRGRRTPGYICGIRFPFS